LNRLGLAGQIRVHFEPSEMCPAVGQGALAIEVRAGDPRVGDALAFLDCADDRAATDCERAVLRSMGGGCQVPIGAYARIEGKGIAVIAVVADPSGGSVLRESRTGTNPESLGRSVGEALLSRGAAKILEQVYGKSVAVPEQP